MTTQLTGDKFWQYRIETVLPRMKADALKAGATWFLFDGAYYYRVGNDYQRKVTK